MFYAHRNPRGNEKCKNIMPYCKIIELYNYLYFAIMYGAVRIRHIQVANI